MMNIHVTLTLAVMLIIAVFHAKFVALEGDRHSIVKRRVKPRVDRELTLQELQLECNHHGWHTCDTKAQSLLDESSEVNKDFSQCLLDAVDTRARSINLQLGDLLNNDQVGSTQEGDKKGNEDQLIPNEKEYQNIKNKISENVCHINRTQKDYARSLYCDSLITVSVLFKHNIMEADNVYPGLKGLAHCVDSHHDPGYFTPQEIIITLEKWYHNMVQRHKCCREMPGKPGFAELLQDNDNQRNNLPRCINNANAEWSRLLAKQSRYMKAVDMLESLGRRRKCLRGCVGEEEVQCVRPVIV